MAEHGGGYVLLFLTNKRSFTTIYVNDRLYMERVGENEDYATILRNHTKHFMQSYGVDSGGGVT